MTPVDLELPLTHSDLPRSPGVHVSDLYNAWYQALQPKRYARTTEPNSPMIALGLAWEAHVEKVLQAAHIKARRMGEFSSEGIAFSPDLMIENGEDRVGEIKLTRFAMPPGPSGYADAKFAKWVTQMKVYCHKLQIPRARLFALHLRGDYRSNRDPMHIVTDFEFTRTELEEEWTSLMRYGWSKGLIP